MKSPSNGISILPDSPEILARARVLLATWRAELHRSYVVHGVEPATYNDPDVARDIAELDEVIAGLSTPAAADGEHPIETASDVDKELRRVLDWMNNLPWVIDALAALARSEPPTEGKMNQAVATQRQPIVPELPKGWVFNDAQECPDEGDGVWAIGFRDEDHFSPIVKVDTGLYYQPQDAEPLARAILARLAAPVASEGDSLLPAPQPTEPPTGEPVAWQERQQRSAREWTPWYDCAARVGALAETIAGIRHEWRPLFTRQPPVVPTPISEEISK